MKQLSWAAARLSKPHPSTVSLKLPSGHRIVARQFHNCEPIHSANGETDPVISGWVHLSLLIASRTLRTGLQVTRSAQPLSIRANQVEILIDECCPPNVARGFQDKGCVIAPLIAVMLRLPCTNENPGEAATSAGTETKSCGAVGHQLNISSVGVMQ